MGEMCVIDLHKDELSFGKNWLDHPLVFDPNY
jgi:hypothetical protein